MEARGGHGAPLGARHARVIGFAFVIAFGGSPALAPDAGRRVTAPAEVPLPPLRADPWFARDKLMHFTASAVIQGTAHAAFRSRGADYGAASRGAAAVTLTVGIGKEVWDHYHPGHDASVRDLAWDVVGGTVGAVVVRQIDR